MWWVPLTATTSGRCRVESRMAPATGGAAAAAPPPGRLWRLRGVPRGAAESCGVARPAGRGARARPLPRRAGYGGGGEGRARSEERAARRAAAGSPERGTHFCMQGGGQEGRGASLGSAARTPPRGPRCAAPRGRRPRQRARITIASRAASRRAARASLRAARSALPALRIAPPERAAPRPSPPSPAPLSSSPSPCSARARRRPAITSGERGTR